MAAETGSGKTGVSIYTVHAFCTGINQDFNYCAWSPSNNDVVI